MDTPPFSFIRDMDLDASSNVYVALHSQGAFPHITGGADQTTVGGRNDVVVAKLNRVATRVSWATYLGGPEDEEVPTLRVDNGGRVFVVTATTSDGLAGPRAYQATRRGGRDMLIARYTPAGVRDATTYYGGSAAEDVETHHLALNAKGQPVIGAATNSADLPMPGRRSPFQRTYAGGGDGFAAILSADLTGLLAATYIGGSGAEHVEGVAVDGLGNIYVGGETGSSDLPASIKTVFHGRTDIWVAKFSSPLQQAPALEYLGGTERDTQRSLWIDAEGNLISTGWINVGSFFDGSGDVYVARILMP